MRARSYTGMFCDVRAGIVGPSIQWRDLIGPAAFYPELGNARERRSSDVVWHQQVLTVAMLQATSSPQVQFLVKLSRLLLFFWFYHEVPFSDFYLTLNLIYLLKLYDFI